MPKRQSGAIPWSSMSFKYVNGITDHFLIFIDSKKNLKLPKTKEPALYMHAIGGFLTAYKLNDETGEASKLSMLELKNVNGMKLKKIEPVKVIQTDLDRVIFEVFKQGGEDVLIELDFKSK